MNLNRLRWKASSNMPNKLLKLCSRCYVCLFLLVKDWPIDNRSVDSWPEDGHQIQPPRIRDIRYLCRIYTLVNRMFETKGIFWQQKRFSLVGQCDLLLRLLRDTTQRLNYRSMDGNDVIAGLNSQSASSCLYARLSVSTTVGCVTLFGTSSRFLGPAPHFFCPLFSQLQRKWNTPRRVLSVLLLWHISQIGTQAKETGLKD